MELPDHNGEMNVKRVVLNPGDQPVIYARDSYEVAEMLRVIGEVMEWDNA